jgi:hypothetical protein
MAIQGKIGQRLRETYQKVVDEKVPDELLDLLEQLKRKEREGKEGDK